MDSEIGRLGGGEVAGMYSRAEARVSGGGEEERSGDGGVVGMLGEGVCGGEAGDWGRVWTGSGECCWGSERKRRGRGSWRARRKGGEGGVGCSWIFEIGRAHV